jgi:hypothetical protein
VRLIYPFSSFGKAISGEHGFDHIAVRAERPFRCKMSVGTLRIGRT